MRKVRVDFFTHPICTGCWDVTGMLDRLTEELPELFELTRWSLATPAGRARAQALGVLEVPTIVVDGTLRIVGVPEDASAIKAQILAARRPETGR